MSKLIERVAKALRNEVINNPIAPSDWDDGCGGWTKYARAALAAMREPTEAMVEAGCDRTDTNANRAEVGRSWQAMIDEVLKEGK